MSLLKAGRDFARRLGNGAKTSLAIVGFFTVASLTKEVYTTRKFLQEESQDKKRVLVLPFYRLKLVNRKDGVSWLRSSSSDDAVEEIEIQDLINLIHEAAQDPQCVAIFGEFGHGRDFSAGLADAEEIRTALRVFRESHRVHQEPNLSHEAVLQRSNREKKRLLAYADTFEGLGSENKDYYLASIFDQIHLQEKGLVGIYGFSATVPFLRKALEKYGANVHVYKHGPFKNAPNSLTETDFTNPHRQNVENYLFALNKYLCEDIATSRKSLSFSDDMWRLIHDSGAFASHASQKMGFVDYTSPRSPLDALLDYRKSKTDSERERIKCQWGAKTDLDSFRAEEKVTLAEYRNIVAKRKKVEHWKSHVFSRIEAAGAEHSILKDALASFGIKGPYLDFSKDGSLKKTAGALSEKIALVQINGTIDGKRVRKVLPCLAKIKMDKDVKAVVVRIDSPGGTINASETLLQELSSLPQNVVFSFGNVSASGGYYIASCADRIFSSKTTLTGSIGVYGIRFDLSKLAAQYGVRFGHVSTSELALANNIFYPCTKQMHVNSKRNVDRAYQDFLTVVTTGRNLPYEYVKSLAGGRVFTGDQAKANGLVDEIGGLNRAIAYARRNFTSGEARVEHFSAEQPFLERLQKYLSNSVMEPVPHVSAERSYSNITPLPMLIPDKACDVYLTIDENVAIRSLMNISESQDHLDEMALLRSLCKAL